jgi:crotonobetainyl-CoA:carnitine CoA-transferase CaiB-like acyl-CoA transferase
MGPLAGLKVIEMAGIGPGPMCAMLLADLGATVLRIDRTAPSDLGIQREARFNLLLRSRKAIPLDLKQPDATALALRLIDKADALVEGFRPGVMERLGLGPEVCLARNPKLIYGRMTGWGQDGPLARAAGHDLNYIALTGALHAIGRAGGMPAVPLNLIGDFGGGALYLAFGIMAGCYEAVRSGQGQVVDAAMIDGIASLMTSIHGMLAEGRWRLERGSNITDSGAPFYDVYICGDGQYVSLGPIEAKFYAELLQRLEIDPATMPPQLDRARWPESRARIATVLLTRTRDEWSARLEGTDVCFAPVLSMHEAPRHPHHAARGTYVTVDGVVQPGPAPRFSRTVPAMPTPPCEPDAAGVSAALDGWLDADEIATLRAAGTLPNP